jgi:glycosyltransferase involved in cell wall biosynthesis
MLKPTVYLHGRDNVGWSIDKDRANINQALLFAGATLCRQPWRARIIYLLWWNQFLTLKMRLFSCLFPKKIYIATITNDITYQRRDFNKIKADIDFWVYANTSQRDFLLDNGIEAEQIFYNPFYVSEHIFRPLKLTKQKIAAKLGIDYARIQDKYLIGSFQRDSLQDSLLDSKWHKNPELIIEVMSKLDPEKYLLILAGPRRHYLVHKCIELGIPYLYYGDERFIHAVQDDILANNQSDEIINLLYNLIDLYLMTSKSEGGPKSVFEAALTQTLILATPVGLVPDFLTKQAICLAAPDFINKIETLSSNRDDVASKHIEENYSKVISINSEEAFKKRIKTFYDRITQLIGS